MLGLIYANLSRRRARTMLTAIGIAVGVGVIVALLSLTSGLKQTASGLIHLGKADLGMFQESAADPTQSVLPTSLVKRVQRTKGVSEATPLQLIVEGIKADPAAIAFGIEHDGFVERRLVLQRGRHARDDEAVVGNVLAHELHLDVGGRIKIMQREFPIVGIYHSGVTFEDQGAILPLPAAQALVGRPDEATTIAVLADPTLSFSELKKRIKRNFPGTFAITEPGEAARAGANVRLINKAVVVITLLALVIGGIAVTNTMMMAVLERQREFALLAAVGWKSRQVAGLILGEGVGVSLIGAGIGLALGLASSELIVRALGADAFVSPNVTAWGLGRGLIVGFAIGVLGGIYPAWRVTRLAPAEVLAGG